MPTALLAASVGAASASKGRSRSAPERERVAYRRSLPLVVPQRPTGLVIDARELPLNRAMSPRILDEDGNVLYPDPKHVPPMSELQDRGMVAYVRDPRDAPRSGGDPLVLPAIAVSGPGRDNVVVSRESAAVLRRESQRHGFLDRWAVSFAVSLRP